MLATPLHFLSYANRRVLHNEKIHVSHEINLLGFHLKENLWLEDKYDYVLIPDECGAELDVSMLVRREGKPGKNTPEGILTRYRNTPFQAMISQIEEAPSSVTIELGFFLLKLSEESVFDLNKSIRRMLKLYRKDKKGHDTTLATDKHHPGLTIHCNKEPIDIAASKLDRHSKVRKYILQAPQWFGVCIDSETGALRFCLNLKYEWEHDEQVEAFLKSFKEGREIRLSKQKPQGFGRKVPEKMSSKKKKRKS